MRQPWRLYFLLFEFVFIGATFLLASCTRLETFLHGTEAPIADETGKDDARHDDLPTTDDETVPDDPPAAPDKQSSRYHSRPLPSALPRHHGHGPGDDRYLADDEATPEFANAMHVYGGCEYYPDDVYVPRKHAASTECEEIQFHAAKDDDGDFYGVATGYSWGSKDPAAVDFACHEIGDGVLCQAKVKKDLFDVASGGEPATDVWGCAINNCTEDTGGCEPTVCAVVTIVSVVNLEDTWTFTGATFDPVTMTAFQQDGRNIRDDTLGLDGTVEDAVADLRLSNVHYLGTISDDRTTIRGYAWQLPDNTLLGEWTARRLSSPTAP